MHRTIGYGENSLTLWAIKKELRMVLSRIGDPSEPDSCFVIYRPSFGRGSPAEFGEFDAIFATLASVYLVESKWDERRHERDWRVKLDDVQILRHRIFEWYLEKWRTRESRETSWDTFAAQNREEFESRFEGKKIAEDPNSLLARNLEYVLTRLDEFGGDIVNLLLFFQEKESPVRVNVEDFLVARIPYATLPGSNFVDLGHLDPP